VTGRNRKMNCQELNSMAQRLVPMKAYRA
jgi:hypothetical protein